MANTYIGAGHRIKRVVPTGGGTGGDVYVLSSGATGMCGIWLQTYSAAATGVLMISGVHVLAAVNNAAFAVGDILYWDDTANKLTKTATGNTRIGRCVELKATAGTTGKVKLNMP